MTIKDVTNKIESIAPLAYQESYDNSGLLVGSPNAFVTGVLIALDITEAVIDEAVEFGFNLVIAHHPLIFKALKNITGRNEVERCIIKAIKHDVAIYAAHTNLDNATEGVNAMICSKLELENPRILQPAHDMLRKVVVFVPHAHAEAVRQAMFNAGCGHIGQYDSCSFNLSGNGTFRALEDTTPYVGGKDRLHTEPETRVETICEAHLLAAVVQAVKAVHPYEEVAWDAYPLSNENAMVGSGMIAETAEPIDEMAFLKKIKSVFESGCVKYSPLTGRKIKRVAVCGGSGNFLIGEAMARKADIFITGELKYHDYFLAEGKILLAEAGHYETEQFTKDLLYQIVKENFTTFATRISNIRTNPINYL